MHNVDLLNAIWTIVVGFLFPADPRFQIISMRELPINIMVWLVTIPQILEFLPLIIVMICLSH